MHSIRKRMDENTARNSTEATTHIRLIRESNARRTHNQLKRTRGIECQYIEAIHIKDAMEPIEMDNETTTVIMVGTNDIKQGKLATECISEYLGVTEKLVLDETKYIVAQSPPKYTINKRDQERETTKFNTYIEATFPNKIALMTKIEESRHLIEKDGIHLTEEASKITADIRIETIMNTHKDRVTETKNEKVLITLDNTKRKNKIKQTNRKQNSTQQ